MESGEGDEGEGVAVSVVAGELEDNSSVGLEAGRPSPSPALAFSSSVGIAMSAGRAEIDGIVRGLGRG